jgi:hypothetical protein
MSNDSVPYKIPAGGLLGRPLRGKHSLSITPAKKGEIGAMSVKDVLATESAGDPTLRYQSPYDGQERDVPIPEGSLKAYFAKHEKDFAFPDAHVIIKFEYTPAEGENIRIPRDKIPQEVKDALKEQGVNFGGEAS